MNVLVVKDGIVSLSPSTYSLGSEEDMEKAAADAGCLIVRPRENELFVDIDTALDMVVYKRTSAILQRFYPFTERVQPSKSGGDRKHVYMTFARTFTNTERVMLQAFLGSDRTREILGWLRIDQESQQTPTVFFEKLP